MSGNSTIQPRRRIARIAGLLYLLQMATGILGFYTHGQLIVPGDAVRTAKSILASEWLFRIGTVSNLVTALVVVILTWMLYAILRPVSRDGALLASFLRLVENAIAAAAIFTDFLALRLLHDAGSLQGFDATQAQALARILISGSGTGLQVAFVFLGAGSAVFSYLWFTSRLIPRFLAGWGIFSSVVLAMITLAVMIFPGLGRPLTPGYMIPMFIYEVGLGLWLLVKGLPIQWPVRS